MWIIKFKNFTYNTDINNTVKTDKIQAYLFER